MDPTNNVHRGKQGGWATDREHLKRLCALQPMEKIRGTRYSFVAEELLESLSCVQIENIDVDIDHNDCTIAATFFQPSQPIDDGLKQILTRQRWNLGGPGQAPRLYPEFKAGWSTRPWVEADELWADVLWGDELGDNQLCIDRFGGSAWRFVEDRCYVRDTTGLILPSGFFWNTHEYSSDFAFFPNDEKKPHLACIISDTLISPNAILRSEIHGAFNLVTYQMAIKRFCDHRIMPVMLFTFQGDDYARITQAHFDYGMGKIVIRQSRQLDLRGPKPTEDAWLLMRWILSTPVGDTLVKSEDGGLPVRAKEPAASPLKPATAAAA